MKPKPLASLNHFTVPYCIALLTSWMDALSVRGAWGDPAHGRSMQSNPRVWQSPRQPMAQDPSDVAGGHRGVGEDVVEGDGFVRIGTRAGGPVGDDGQARIVESHLARERGFGHAG